MKQLTIILLGLLLIGTAYGQDEEKLTVKPSGCILMDAGAFHADHYNDKFNDGVAIPDVRIGLEARYGKWKSKVDIGFAYAKLSLKDIFMEYVFNNENLLRGGYFVYINSGYRAQQVPHSRSQWKNQPATKPSSTPVWSA